MEVKRFCVYGDWVYGKDRFGPVNKCPPNLHPENPHYVYASDFDRILAERDTLRAQLAERDALLRGYQSLLRQVLPCLAMSTNSQAASYMRQIDAALSASAEPSPPKCCAPTAQEEALLASGDYRPEELWGGPRPTCPKCIKPGPKSCAACANGCISGCQLVEKDSPPSECQHRYMHFGDQDKRRCADCSKVEPSSPKCGHAACKSLGEHHPFCNFVQAIEPSAPVERDERAEFEAWVLTRKVCTHKGAMLKKDRAGNYLDYRINDRWLTWQARAALERKP